MAHPVRTRIASRHEIPWLVAHVVAVAVLLGACTTNSGARISAESDTLIFREALHRAECVSRVDQPTAREVLGLGENLRAAAWIAESQQNAAARCAMLSEVYGIYYRLAPSARALVGSLSQGFVPLLTDDTDQGSCPRIVVMEKSTFYVDLRGLPVGYRGPKVAVELGNPMVVDRGTVPNPFAQPQPDADGAFVDESNPACAGMGTAFWVANTVIAEMERWAGREIRWGRDGQLRIVTYSAVSQPLTCLFDGENREVHLGVTGELSPDGGLRKVMVDAARSRDAVAHECAHAAVAALKPGFYTGIAVALSEALADMTACLVALGDPSVVERVLAETGGDLRRNNEAARICETIGRALSAPGNHPDEGIRTVATSSGLKDLGLRPDSAALPSPDIDMVVGLDEHAVSQAISGALWELLADLYDALVGYGATREEGILQARETVGTLMMRALDYVGEHALTPRDYALALLRVAAELRDGRCGRLLQSALCRRNLIDPIDNLDIEVRAERSWLPRFHLDPGAAAQDLLPRLSELEKIPAADPRLTSKAAYDRLMAIAMLPRVMRLARQAAERGDGWVSSDTTTRDGTRVIRLACGLRESRIAEFPPAPTFEGASAGTAVAPARARLVRYASLVFDRNGDLAAMHVDEPVFE